MLFRILSLLLFIAIVPQGVSFAAHKKKCYSSHRSVPAIDIRSSEEKAVAEINKIRQEKGLAPLKNWPELANCARQHSQNMACKKCRFGHDGFDKRFDMMDKVADIETFGENVANSYNYQDPVQVAVQGWMTSKGHREHILGDFAETGIGIAISEDGTFYITQLFSTRS